MRKAFTLIELIVSLGILAVVLSFAGLIFRVSIESHRMALANAEIMQKLRVITGQLDTDFKSMIFEYGAMGRTRTYTIDGEDDEEVEVGSDTIVFFASGDFQSTAQYGDDDDTVAGNVAAIFYGRPDPNSYDREPEPRETWLLRRQTILASEAEVADSDPNGEYYATSLGAWMAGTPADDLAGWSRSPLIDPHDIEANQAMYLARGVHNFTISYLERDDQVGTEPLAWQRRSEDEEGDEILAIDPYVFKFTFTLYDSRGIIKNGRTFTHIVFVGS
jgi:prepilin-type N-terminal cleavage/methylation domain-containing protein